MQSSKGERVGVRLGCLDSLARGSVIYKCVRSVLSVTECDHREEVQGLLQAMGADESSLSAETRSLPQLLQISVR